MSGFDKIVTVAIAGLTLALGAGAVSAQDAKKGAGSNPAGAAWSAATTPETSTLDAKQTEIVKRVGVYFNDLANMRGSFVQTSADNKRMRGKFYVKKPGRFRFDYALPSKQVILSDGRFLRIYDLDLDKEDPFELDNTPFRILLKADVDLLRDARINEAQEADDVIIVALQDKSPDTPGRIKVVLVKKPVLELKEWVTTDAQGLDTRMELSDINRSDDIDVGLFKPLQLKQK